MAVYEGRASLGQTQNRLQQEQAQQSLNLYQDIFGYGKSLQAGGLQTGFDEMMANTQLAADDPQAFNRKALEAGAGFVKDRGTRIVTPGGGGSQPAFGVHTKAQPQPMNKLAKGIFG